LPAVERQFQPDDDASNQLTEALYALLMDEPISESLPASDSLKPPCFRVAPE